MNAPADYHATTSAAWCVVGFGSSAVILSHPTLLPPAHVARFPRTRQQSLPSHSATCVRELERFLAFWPTTRTDPSSSPPLPSITSHKEKSELEAVALQHGFDWPALDAVMSDDRPLYYECMINARLFPPMMMLMVSYDLPDPSLMPYRCYVELKPKAGLLPLYDSIRYVDGRDRTVPPLVHSVVEEMHPLKRCVERFAMMQAYKHAMGTSGREWSHYSGTQLFSQEETQMRCALDALIAAPQNNWSVVGQLQPPHHSGYRPLSHIVAGLLAVSKVLPTLRRLQEGIPAPALDIELLTALVSSRQVDGSWEARRCPSGEWEPLSATRDALVDAFYTSVTAKDVSIGILLSLSASACDGDVTWAPLQVPSLLLGEWFEARCGSAQRSEGLARVLVLDVDSKHHKPLSWYMTRDAAILDAYMKHVGLT